MLTCVISKITNTFIYCRMVISIFCDWCWIKTITTYSLTFAQQQKRYFYFTCYSFTNRYTIPTWNSGFNRGYNQFFILYLNKGSRWRELGNLTDPDEGREVKFDHGLFTPGTEYWFRLKSCNSLNCSSTPADVRAVVKGIIPNCFISLFDTQLNVI